MSFNYYYMRNSKKKFNYAKDVYYFNIKAAQGEVTIHRKDKENAMKTFKQYQKNMKECQWLGKWNGKKFEESGLFAQPGKNK